jgi:hypothetical protein
MRHPFTSWLWWMPNDLDTPSELRLDPMLSTPRVALVDPEMRDARKLLVGAFQQQWDAGAILNVCRVHPSSKNQATSIYEDVPFAAIDAFAAVVATDTADASGPNGLAVDDASARLGVAPDTGAELLAKTGVEALPRAIQTPQPEVMVGGLPSWEFVRKQTPGAATPHDVEDGVQDLASRVQARSTKLFGRREQWFETSELSIRQVGQVGSP